jgi:hypothetical protein
MKAAGSVELPDRDQIEEVEEPRQLRDRRPDWRARHSIHDVRRDPRAEAPGGPGKTDLRIGQRIGHTLLQHDECAEAGNEERRPGIDAESPQHVHMPHLVHVQRQREPRSQRPSELTPVEAEEGEHREERLRLRQTEQEKLELAEREEEDRDAGGNTLLPPRTGMCRRWKLSLVSLDRRSEVGDTRVDGPHLL